MNELLDDEEFFPEEVESLAPEEEIEELDELSKEFVK